MKTEFFTLKYEVTNETYHSNCDCRFNSERNNSTLQMFSVFSLTLNTPNFLYI